MGMKDWSTTASENDTAGSVNFAEGQAPSTVNDSNRQEMADVRAWTDDGGWHLWGHTTTYGSGTTFTISGVDVTAIYAVGRRVRAVGSLTGTIYGRISASAFSTNTTVTVVWDSGSLSNEALTISVSFINVTGDPIPAGAVEPATTSLAGISELATTTEVLTGTDTSRAVTPDALASLWEKGSDVASATTLSLGEGGLFHVTGTVTITDIDFATDKSGRAAILVFDGILTLTYNATTLILPGAASITTAAGDCCKVVSENGTDNVRVVWYQRASGAPLGIPYLEYRDEKAAGTAGGTFTSGAWRTRTLNTEAADTGAFGSVSSNQITLAAGTYECWISAPAYRCDQHQAKLYNITATANALVGASEFTRSADDSTVSRSVVVGRFTIAASTVFEVQHRCAITRATDGLGVAANLGETEVYTVARFWKVA